MSQEDRLTKIQQKLVDVNDAARKMHESPPALAQVLMQTLSVLSDIVEELVELSQRVEQIETATGD